MGRSHPLGVARCEPHRCIQAKTKRLLPRSRRGVLQPARGSQAPSWPRSLGGHQVQAGGCGVASPNRRFARRLQGDLTLIDPGLAGVGANPAGDRSSGCRVVCVRRDVGALGARRTTSWHALQQDHYRDCSPSGHFLRRPFFPSGGFFRLASSSVRLFPPPDRFRRRSFPSSLVSSA